MFLLCLFFSLHSLSASTPTPQSLLSSLQQVRIEQALLTVREDDLLSQLQMLLTPATPPVCPSLPPSPPPTLPSPLSPLTWYSKLSSHHLIKLAYPLPPPPPSPDSRRCNKTLIVAGMEHPSTLLIEAILSSLLQISNVQFHHFQYNEHAANVVDDEVASTYVDLFQAYWSPPSPPLSSSLSSSLSAVIIRAPEFEQSVIDFCRDDPIIINSFGDLVDVVLWR